MAEQEEKKVEAVTPVAPAPVETKSDVAEGKVTAPPPPVAAEEEKAATAAEESKALAIVEKTEPAPKKVSGGSIDRDIALADLEKEKRLSFIKAWEDSEKTKAENKSQKKLTVDAAWENSKKAALEAKKYQGKTGEAKGTICRENELGQDFNRAARNSVLPETVPE